MNEKDFEREAHKTLLYIAELIEEMDHECLIDLDYMSDILKLETDKGPFIINKHRAARQIWLASPISGPYHFSPQNNKWINVDDVDLFELLNKELKEFIEIELKYE